jgi:hypothetical protein
MATPEFDTLCLWLMFLTPVLAIAVAVYMLLYH